MASSWKRAERRAAQTISGKRYWANSGQIIDCESDSYVCQVKEVQRLSLAQLEALALEVERQGSQRQKLGLVIVKRRAGRGRETPQLITMTESVFREMNGARALAFMIERNSV
jgi:hypothetical protein